MTRPTPARPPLSQRLIRLAPSLLFATIVTLALSTLTLLYAINASGANLALALIAPPTVLCTYLTWAFRPSTLPSAYALGAPARTTNILFTGR